MRVFLSYTHTDISLVEQVNSGLREHGFEPWLAACELNCGDQLSEIEQQLKQSDAFIVFLSSESVNSPWVAHECAIARWLYLNGKLQRIVPCLLKDDVQIPIGLVDFVSVHLRASNFAEGLYQIIRALQGTKPSLSRYAQFRNFVETLVVVDKQTSGFVTDQHVGFLLRRDSLQAHLEKRSSKQTFNELYLESLQAERAVAISFDGTVGDAILLRSKYERALQDFQFQTDSQIESGDIFQEYNGSMLSPSDHSYLVYRLEKRQPFPLIDFQIKFNLDGLLRARRAIEEHLTAANVVPEKISFVLDGIDRYGSLRVISANDVQTIKQWVRSADEDLVQLASALIKDVGGKIGIEFEWIIDLIADANEDTGMAEYRAHRLAQRAVETGLLERPEYRDYRVYYDFGPLLWMAGPIALSFETEVENSGLDSIN